MQLQGSPPPYYRQNVFVPPDVLRAGSAPLVGSGLRTTKLVLGIVQTIAILSSIVFWIVGAVLGPQSDAAGLFFGLGGAGFGLWYLLLIAYGIVGMVWMYKFWSWIPPDQRHTPPWKKYISPGMALGYMFIPYFNIYWMFVVYLGIADILERMRVQFPTQRPPAKTLALVRLIVPLVFFPAAPFLDFFFDKHVEGMAADMQAGMDAQIGVGRAAGVA